MREVNDNYNNNKSNGTANSLQNTDIGNYSFVNGTIRNWNQLPGEVLGTFPCKSKIFRKRFRKAIMSGMKQKE